jgi:hypothetical protein
MKLHFQNGLIPTIDPEGQYEVVETNLIHRFSLVDGEVVDKYPGKTDRQIQEIEHAAATVANTAAIKAWDEDEANEGKPGRPEPLPALREE